jgi:hypothetical protein
MSEERTILPKAEPDKHLKKKSRSSSAHSNESSPVQVRTTDFTRNRVRNYNYNDSTMICTDK